MKSAPHFVGVLTFAGKDDQRVILSIWAGDVYATCWSSSAETGNFREERIHCGTPPKSCGYGQWALINVLAAMIDSGWVGVVTLALEGAVTEPDFYEALDFVNECLPMPEPAETSIDDLC